MSAFDETNVLGIAESNSFVCLARLFNRDSKELLRIILQQLLNLLCTAHLLRNASRIYLVRRVQPVWQLLVPHVLLLYFCFVLLK